MSKTKDLRNKTTELGRDLQKAQRKFSYKCQTTNNNNNPTGEPVIWDCPNNYQQLCMTPVCKSKQPVLQFSNRDSGRINFSPLAIRNRHKTHVQTLKSELKNCLQSLSYTEKLGQIQLLFKSARDLCKQYGYFFPTFAMLRIKPQQKIKLNLWIHPDSRSTKPLHPIKKDSQFQCQIVCVGQLKAIIRQLVPIVDLGTGKTFSNVIGHVGMMKNQLQNRKRRANITTNQILTPTGQVTKNIKSNENPVTLIPTPIQIPSQQIITHINTVRKYNNNYYNPVPNSSKANSPPHSHLHIYIHQHDHQHEHEHDPQHQHQHQHDGLQHEHENIPMNPTPTPTSAYSNSKNPPMHAPIIPTYSCHSPSPLSMNINPNPSANGKEKTKPAMNQISNNYNSAYNTYNTTIYNTNTYNTYTTYNNNNNNNINSNQNSKNNSKHNSKNKNNIPCYNQNGNGNGNGNCDAKEFQNNSHDRKYSDGYYKYQYQYQHHKIYHKKDKPDHPTTKLKTMPALDGQDQHDECVEEGMQQYQYKSQHPKIDSQPAHNQPAYSQQNEQQFSIQPSLQPQPHTQSNKQSHPSNDHEHEPQASIEPEQSNMKKFKTFQKNKETMSTLLESFKSGNSIRERVRAQLSSTPKGRNYSETKGFERRDRKKSLIFQDCKDRSHDKQRNRQYKRIAQTQPHRNLESLIKNIKIIEQRIQADTPQPPSSAAQSPPASSLPAPASLTLPTPLSTSTIIPSPSPSACQSPHNSASILQQQQGSVTAPSPGSGSGLQSQSHSRILKTSITVGKKIMSMSIQMESEINNLFGDDMSGSGIVYYQEGRKMGKNSMLSKVAEEFQDIF